MSQSRSQGVSSKACCLQIVASFLIASSGHGKLLMYLNDFRNKARNSVNAVEGIDRLDHKKFFTVDPLKSVFELYQEVISPDYEMTDMCLSNSYPV